MTLRFVFGIVVSVVGVSVSSGLTMAQSAPSVDPTDARQVKAVDLPERATPRVGEILQVSVASPGAPAINPADTWEGAQRIGTSAGKLVIVTVDQAGRRQTCRVRTFTMDQIVCKRGIYRSRTFLRQQIAALILPGDGAKRLPLWLGLNAGLGTAIWGTVVLTATCPVCAAGTAIAALFFFGAAGAAVYADDVPDRLLYLAPGQELSEKPGSVQP